MTSRHSLLLTLAAAAVLGACGDDTPPPRTFLDGTASDPGILLAVNLDKALFMLQTGAPDQRVSIALGASATVTPVGLSVFGNYSAVPLGNVGSVAYVNLATETVDRYFTFPSGNATGSAFVNPSTVVVCNQTTDQCGKFDPAQVGTEITGLVTVTQFPTSVVATGGRVFVVSSNLDDSYMQAGPGVVTEINPATMEIVRTFEVGANPQYAATANNKVYVVNSGDYGLNNGTLSVINLASNTVDPVISGFGDFPGPINIDTQGRAFISSFNYGTAVWNTVTEVFVKSPAVPLCVPSSGGACRGAADAVVAPNGDVYQAYFGSAALSEPAYYFVYDGSTFSLKDSIAVPIGPSGLVGVTFE
jgi:hypothetical protein